MLKKVIAIAILFISTHLVSEEINWITSTEKAFNKAKEENKSVFVLITAPSWCHWCIKFENDVLSKDNVKEYLNKNYVNLMLLDRVNGKENPELSNFIFEGFPTIAVFDNNMGKVRQFSSFKPQEFINIMEDLKGKTGIRDPFIPKEYKIDDNVLKFDGSKGFILGSEEYLLVTRDQNFFFLVNKDENRILYIPYKGGKVLTKELVDNNWGEVQEFGIGEKVGE